MKTLAFFFAAFVLLIGITVFAWRTRSAESPRQQNPLQQPSHEEVLRQEAARKFLSENANWETGPRHRETPAGKDW
jgi:hypothetical protein